MMFALAPRALSVLVLLVIHDPFLNIIIASFYPILHFSISVHKIGDIFINSSYIFNKTPFACLSVPEHTTILLPGYRIHLTTQKRAVSQLLDIPLAAMNIK